MPREKMLVTENDFNKITKFAGEEIKKLAALKKENNDDRRVWSYLQSYPDLLRSDDEPIINRKMLVRLAHMCYGWMPTVLTINFERFNDKNIYDLNNVSTGTLDLLDNGGRQKLEDIHAITNNSYIGLSKLLHFLYPEKFAIYDSKVLGVLLPGRNCTPSFTNDLDRFISYQTSIQKFCKNNTKFVKKTCNTLKDKLNYEVSPLRAMEMILFSHAGMNIGE